MIGLSAQLPSILSSPLTSNHNDFLTFGPGIFAHMMFLLRERFTSTLQSVPLPQKLSYRVQPAARADPD